MLLTLLSRDYLRMEKQQGATDFGGVHQVALCEMCVGNMSMHVTCRIGGCHLITCCNNMVNNV